MVLPEFGDPVAHCILVLEAQFPATDFTDDEMLMSRGLSVRPGKPFIFIQQVGSQMSSHLLQDNPRIEVITYVYGDKTAGLDFARDVQRALFLAAFNQTVTVQGHMRRFFTETGPYTQRITGLSSQITRCSATYRFGYRSR